ncbi:PilZ domain-containing protein [Sphingomonas sp.]|uniref:PilZ domain-containing protein n=1 Tax=Sphingomonas sp. TaxID=28214 RepID=UPI0031D3D2B9
MFAAEFEPAEYPCRRRSAQTSVAIDADMDRGGLARALCRVLDISVHGARLQTYTALRRGSTIWLRLPKVGEVTARIIWATDFSAGCQFQTPLAPEAYESLPPLG